MKLTDKQVEEIRTLANKPQVFGVDIAKQYNVSPSTISLIWSGKRRVKKEK